MWKPYILLTFAFFALALSNGFQANFKMTHPRMKGGVVKGDFKYSWDLRRMKFHYSKSDYNEAYEFNPQRGQGGYENQWVYKWGRGCECETGSIQHPMPPLHKEPGAYNVGQGSASVSGKNCILHKPRDKKSMVKNAWFNGGTLCKVEFVDGRIYTFDLPYAGGEPNENQFQVTSNCKCGKPIDVVVVLDRSSSIQKNEWVQQKNFLDLFAREFTYGVQNANLAVQNFNSKFWTTMELRVGSSTANVKNTLAGMKCCSNLPPNKKDSCCCCGTSVSGGMIEGAKLLSRGRAQAKPVMIVITDGYHNTMHNGKRCGKDGATDCMTDLRNAVNRVKQAVPGRDVSFFAIGVGVDRAQSFPQLQAVADGDKNRVIMKNNFKDLARDVSSLVARACDENTNPCGTQCCGFCTCGKCVKPDGCEQQEKCTKVDWDQSNKCCVTKYELCKNSGNPCVVERCDPNVGPLGKCVPDPVKCKKASKCIEYSCVEKKVDPTDVPGICKAKVKDGCLAPPIPEGGSPVSPPPIPVQCRAPTDCDDNNICTDDFCENDMCRYAPKQCPQQSDKCYDRSCDPTRGCVETLKVGECDDGDLCTVDFCVDGACDNSPIDCDDQDDCTQDSCDPSVGCVHVPIVCDEDVPEEDCVSVYCEGGECKRLDECVPPILTPPIAGLDEITVAGAGLGTAAIVGIVLAAVLVLGLGTSGGVYAYSQAAATNSLEAVGNNPLYTGKGFEGTNPLYHNMS